MGIFATSVYGTPYYLAPEVCEAEPYDERSDIWSLGVVFYEMCTLQLPFSGTNILAVVKEITAETPIAFPKDVKLDRRFEVIIKAMMQRDPKKRPSSQMILDKHLVLPVSHPSHPSHTPAASRRIQEFHGPDLSAPSPAVPPSKHVDPMPASPIPDPKSEPPAKASARQPASAESSSSSEDGSHHEAVDDATAAPRTCGDAPPAEVAPPIDEEAKWERSGSKRDRGWSTSMTGSGSANNSEKRSSQEPPAEGAKDKKATSTGGAKKDLQIDSTGGNAKSHVSPEKSHGKQLVSSAEHSAALSRIRSAKSKLNVGQMRRAMRQRLKEQSQERGEMEGEVVLVPCSTQRIAAYASPPHVHVDPTSQAVTLQSSPQSEKPLFQKVQEGGAGGRRMASPKKVKISAVEPPPKNAESENEGHTPTVVVPESIRALCSSLDAPVAVASAPSANQPAIEWRNSSGVPCSGIVREVMNLIVSHGDRITLDDVDEIAHQLNRYKLNRFGMC